MPKKAYTVCSMPRCNKLTHGAVCVEHEFEYKARQAEAIKQRSRKHESKRLSASQRGYDHKWKKARDSYLLQNPFCVDCKNKNKIVKAGVVDHIKPHKGSQALFWDRENWQPLCASCHNTKTATKDGGFGRNREG